jgi:hypothetical protein
MIRKFTVKSGSKGSTHSANVELNLSKVDSLRSNSSEDSKFGIGLNPCKPAWASPTKIHEEKIEEVPEEHSDSEQ